MYDLKGFVTQEADDNPRCLTHAGKLPAEGFKV